MNRTVLVESLEPRRLFAGVTVLATGRLGSTNGWVQSMSNEITAKMGGVAQVPEYRLSINADSSTGNLVATIQHTPGTATPQSGSSGEIVVLIDYYNVSANPIYSSTYIGQVIANYMMSTPVDGILLASLPIHEIGVSRGTAILEGASKAFGQAGVWVDQETYLDPNPIGAQGDPPSTIFDNVAFVDDYWRNDGSASQVNDGNPVNGAYNLHLSWLDTSAPGYSIVHLAPSGYYEGTIDLNATQGGEGPIPSSWYGNTPTMPARNATGFFYSAIMGGTRPLSGVWTASGGSGARTAAGQSGTQWGDVTDLAVTSGNSVATGNPFQVSYLQQDRDSADTVTFFLDTDRNPYNNAFAATLGTANFAETDAITQRTATLSASVAAGTYWLGVKVTDAQGNTRYTYEPVTSQLTVTATANPFASLASPAPISSTGSQAESLVVTYKGSGPIDATSLDSSDLQVSGPGFTTLATYVGVDGNTGSNTRVATYSLPAPAGGWAGAMDGTYTVSMQSNQVKDTSSRFVPAGTLGSFNINISLLGAGSLSGSQATAASSYNLTTLGAADWAHWGRSAQYASFDHKSAGGSQISNVTTVGTGGNFGGYSDPTRSVTWTDGAPTASDANEHGYIWSNGALNTGYSFTVPADTTTRTLTVYAGGINTTSSLTAHLSDGSALDAVMTAGTAGLYTNVYTITYHAALAGQTLTITLLKTGNLNGRTDGSADLIAAYLTTGAPAADTTKPTATLQATPTVTVSNSAATLTVVYTDNVAVKASTLTTGDLTLSGPTSQTASFVSASPSGDNATITATYSVAAPAGGWTTAANGTYTVSLAGSSVSDTSSNFALAASLGSFQIAIPGPDTAPPQASLQATPTVTSSASPATLNVVYTDNVLVKNSTLATGNLALSGPTAQTASFVGSSPSSDNATITATYTVAAPAGGWTTAANGTYTVSLAGSSVSDTSSNFALVASLGSFQIAIPVPGAGSLSAQSADAASGAVYNLTTLGTSDWAHWGRASNAGNFDHKATGGSQISNITNVGAGANTGGYSNTIRSTTWTDGAPTGSDANEHGFIYSNGALNSGVSFTVPADTSTRTLTVLAGGADTTSTLTAHLSDNSASDVTITSSQRGVYTKLYTIVYHAGAAGQTLTVTLLKTANLAGPTSSADLIAAWLSGAPAADTTPPQATLQATPTVTASNSSATLKVVYTDNAAVKFTTLATGNLTLSGPTNQAASFVSSSPSSDNATITATYSVAAPAGGWTTAANGAYTVSLAGTSVSDTSNNFALAASLGSFQIAIPGPDITPPTASLQATATVTSPASAATLTVVYTDNVAVKASTLTTGDLTLSGPTSQTASFVGASPSGDNATITATYSIAAPAGGWTTAANGTYTVSLASSSVSDTSSNFALAATLGSFQIAIPAPGAGSLTGVQSTPAASYNLTTLGTTDWAHWGRGNNYANFDHKATGGSKISNVTVLGAGSHGSWYDPSRSVNWTDGTPTSSDADSAYIWANNAIGAGFSFTAPADTTTRTLYVYAGGNGSGATLTATLSDGSAAPYVVTASGTGLYTNFYIITYKAASAGQTLTISYVKSTTINGNNGGSVDLIAAALA